MQQPDLERFHSACNDVVQAADSSKAVRYAVGYASHGMRISDDESIRVQCLYILNNIAHWRGDTAKRARAIFKEFAA